MRSTPDLIEPEGTNAASAESTKESNDPPTGADVTSGGDPDAMLVEQDGVDDRDLTGSTSESADRSAEPEAGESGQDSGLMD